MHSIEVKALLGLCQQLLGVHAPGQALLNLDSQEAEVSHPLQRSPHL